MKKGIHPKYYPNAKVTCACGNTWTTGSTSEVVQTDICSKCHPFYTGEQRIVDTEGQVDRFYRKLAAREEFVIDQEERDSALVSTDISISALELGKRTESALDKAGVKTIGDTLERMSKGDKDILAISGFGRKSLADLKRSLRKRGYEIPAAAEQTDI